MITLRATVEVTFDPEKFHDEDFADAAEGYRITETALVRELCGELPRWSPDVVNMRRRVLFQALLDASEPHPSVKLPLRMELVEVVKEWETR